MTLPGSPVSYLLRLLLLRLVWLLGAPFAFWPAGLGVCWLIDWLDRHGALDR